MKIIQEFFSSEIFYDNSSGKESKRVIDVEDNEIVIDFQEIINTQFSGGNVSHKYEDLKSFLNLGLFASAPDGGFINFYLIKSRNYNDYIIYSGINEVYNGHYLVKIHKILQDEV